ncbi:nucleotide sugar dehydrogenase [Sulfitobacter donghicola]|uniref:Vi polysaccharide biosynthesis protein vipA/tviB n=1 Tax=Sulfitobacter donghicola DSW-25 = KCTC 12864 = JCM 14565 TaxID=1300350 RepID=A0A073IIV9_9RHOB|nr:nucleotide sugar dehydrogenase [Sulfitobacter donghicola]KEJ89694.1 Vi polysaccharide biosynthesis protein vipA/tviB [Sulfitobacter donghicola DSW-25 = KCTC 12864 = JCM 14565]KIN67215.1 UDP-glucose/GDP-mannose dehydrogenase family protein [Sulfitobacter donghicola DSW-25 = KCTC 12864 = JCM 14565]
MTTTSKSDRIAILGLGYVGLPLALGLARNGFQVVGYDIHPPMIDALCEGRDPNGEIDDAKVASSTAVFTHNAADLAGCTAFIIAVPTPITDAKAPDLGPILGACATIAPHLTDGALVILESTVYPGVTEDVCGPALAKASGLETGRQIKLAYSPERVNPGDVEHSMENVIKVIAAQDDETLDRVEAIYSPVVKAGLHRASSIATAEAAKVIENTQRDLNIALVNEFALIFERLGLDTLEVLEAAGTKWNFLPFKPGLVGGHCIGVDPYYLTFRAQQLGYHPEVILAGRRINDAMGAHVAQTLVKAMLKRDIGVRGARVLILGYTFKENCADTRNTRVSDIISELDDYAIQTDVHDPWVGTARLEAQHGVKAVETPELGAYDAILVAVGHREFVNLGSDAIRAFGKEGAVLYDIKGVFGKSGSDLRL